MSLVWKNLLRDYLEMRSPLTEEEREWLISELARRGLRSNDVATHASFSMKGKTFVVCEGEADQELWLYQPKTKEMKHYKCSNSLKQRFEKEKELMATPLS